MEKLILIFHFFTKSKLSRKIVMDIFPIIWIFMFHSILLTSGTFLYPLVDVKGNGAIRQIRLLYDIYDKTTSKQSDLSDTITMIHGSKSSKNLDKYWLSYKTSPQVMYPWTSGPRMWSEHNRFYNLISPDYETGYHDRHPQRWSEYNYGVYGKVPSVSNKLSTFQSTRLKLNKDIPINYLIRGKAMFAEVDFVPRYIPQWTTQVVISVTLPAHIRGRPWILGYHQEQFSLPECRLCTNIDQSYTLPITIFLPDDGWCPEGRVQTIWKIEAIQQQPRNQADGGKDQKISMSHRQQQIDQTDMILAYGYDDLKQLYITNDKNSSHCRDINEAIVS